MKRLTFALSCLLLSGTSANAGSVTEFHRLYCGDIHVSDLNVFSDTESYVGVEKDLVASCYVIKTGDKILLWDTGLPYSIADNENNTLSAPPFTLKVTSKITDELTKIGLKPEDITHIGISHAHFDHTGGVSLFPNAHLIIQKAEFDLLKNNKDEADAHHMSADSLAFYLKDENSEHVTLLNGDAPLFDNSSLKAISLPGHTPGHMALLVSMDNGKKYVLSGDQWHFIENLESNGVPSFNFDRANTLASSDKLNKIIENTGATLVIQHEPKDIDKIQ